MGAFFLAPGDDVVAVESARKTLGRQGFRRTREIEVRGLRLLVCPRVQDEDPTLVEFGNGSFAVAAGTFIFNRKRDSAALEEFFREFDGDLSLLNQAAGPFALVLNLDDEAVVTTDLAGGFPVFRAGSTFSTSFLALAESLPKTTLHRQGVYEFVLTGAPLGDDTPLVEVTRLPHRAVARLGGGVVSIDVAPAKPPDPSDAPLEQLLACVDERLDSYVGAVASAFDGRVVCPVTSGYDSRLLFALLRRCGVRPHTFITTRGADDVDIARAVTAAEQIDLAVIDPTQLSHPSFEEFPSVASHPSLEEFPSVAKQTFLHSDGWLFYGIFNNRVERSHRLERTSNGLVFFHGGGGGVFRNFFMLPDRRLNARQVAVATYAKFDPRVCAPPGAFDEYIHRVASKMEALIGQTGRLPRHMIESLYPHFRCRAWLGRENGLRNWVRPSVTPFHDASILAVAQTVPLRHRRSGAFQAALIARARPEVAAVMSQYGHNFASAPPLVRRAKDLTKDWIPARARPALYAARQRRMAPQAPDRYLDAEFVRTVLPSGRQRVGPIFDQQRLDPQQRARLLSIEYLAEQLDSAPA